MNITLGILGGIAVAVPLVAVAAGLTLLTFWVDEQAADQAAPPEPDQAAP